MRKSTTGTRHGTTETVTGEPDDRKRSRPVRAGGRWKRTRPRGRHLASGLPERRLREHGLIERIPRTHRYQVTDAGLRHAMFLTRVHDRVLLTGIAQLNSPAPAALRQADRAYHAAICDLTRSAGLAA